MKRRLILLNIALLSLSMAAGQQYNRPPNMLEYDEKKWHFGFTLGPEFQKFRVTNNSANLLDAPNITLPTPSYDDIENAYYYSEMTNMGIGFHVGVIVSLRLGKYFNLRAIPTLSLGQRTINSQMYIEEKSGEDFIVYKNDDGFEKSIVKSTQLSLPILMKYKAVRINNIRPYIVAGPNFKCDLIVDYEEPITMKRFDTFLEFGFGSDFYMESFRLGVELRIGIGFMDLLQHNRPENDPSPYITSSISKINARTFTVAFNFE